MHPPVLVIGHDDDRLQAVRSALAAGRLTNPVVACRDASDTHDYVMGRAAFADRSVHPLPAVVVTDLRLDRGSGLDVLRLVRNHLSLRRTPVVVIADDAEDHEIAEVEHLGATAFLSQHLAAAVLLGVIRDADTPWAIGRAGLGA